jgi:metallo-beta-lactamase class B
MKWNFLPAEGFPGKQVFFCIFYLVFFSLAHGQSSSRGDSAGNKQQIDLDESAKQQHWNVSTEPFNILGPLYYVGTEGIASYLVKTADGLILMNSGMKDSGPLIESSILKLGFRPTDIKIILVSHAHADHAGAVAYLKKISGAKLVVMDREKPLIESGGRTDFAYGSNQSFYYEPVKVDKVLQDGDSVKMGNITIYILLTAGHTKGSTTFVMQLTEGEKTYKVVIADGSNINSEYRVFINPSYPGIASDLQNTFKTLNGLDPDIWLTWHTGIFRPGEKHHQSLSKGVAAWEDPEGYKTWINNNEKKFEAEKNKEIKNGE